MTSPLQLERVFFAKVHIEAQQRFESGGHCNTRTTVELARDNNDVLRYVVRLRVELLSPEKGTPPYLGQVEVVGIFKVASSISQQQREQLAGVNGASILYGSAREMVAGVTARGPWPMVMLGTMNFLKPDQEQRLSQPSVPVPSDQTSTQGTSSPVTSASKS